MYVCTYKKNSRHCNRKTDLESILKTSLQSSSRSMLYTSLLETKLVVPLIYMHLLNTTTRIPFEILFVMLIGATVIRFGIQCLHENEKTAKCSGSCIQIT